MDAITLVQIIENFALLGHRQFKKSKTFPVKDK